MYSRLRRFLADDSGATAVEYAVMVGMLIVACMTAIAALGNSNSGMIGDINTQLNEFM